MLKRTVLLSLFVLLGLFLLSGSICDESLPTRSQPDQVYKVKLEIVTPNADDIRRNTDQVEAGKGSLGFNVTVTSIFDETLVDTVQLEFGAIDIWWAKQPDVTRSIPLSIGDEAITREFLYGGIIVFDPADSVFLPMPWRYIDDDDGIYMWEHLTKLNTLEGERYPKMEFRAQAKVQFFEQTAMVYSDLIRFSIHFYLD